MAKKADTPQPVQPESPSLVQSRKIIQVSSDDDSSTEPVASGETSVTIKKTRIEPLSTKPADTKADAAKGEAVPVTTEAAVAPKITDLSTDKPAEPAAKEETPIAAATSTNKPSAEPKPAESPDAPKPEKPAKTDEVAEKPNEETPAAAEADTPPEPESGFDLGDDKTGDDGQHPLDEAQTKVDKEALAKQQALDKLVEAETYFLPINAVEKRRAKFVWAALLLVVVVGAAAAVWANNAGYLTIPGL